MLMFFATVFIAYAAALAFSLAFEVPVMHLDKLLFAGGNSSKARKSAHDTDDAKRENQQPPHELKPLLVEDAIAKRVGVASRRHLW